MLMGQVHFKNYFLTYLSVFCNHCAWRKGNLAHSVSQLPTLIATRGPQVNLATLSRLHSVPANDLLAIFMLFDDANP